MKGSCNQYFGKYRGKVEDTFDLTGSGLIKVSVPAVLGEGKMAVATPCVPFAGPGVGFYFIPSKGANIWVEFEGGDPDFPIWTGCFWGAGEAPSILAEEKMIKTKAGTIALNELSLSGEISIETKGGLKISLGDNGIEITNGKGGASITMSLAGPTVMINKGALQVD